ncbi:unnamed protein product [Lota lota]
MAEIEQRVGSEDDANTVLREMEKDNILRLAIHANKTNPLLYGGPKIFISADMSTGLYPKLKKYAAVKKQLWVMLPKSCLSPSEKEKG